MQSFVDTDYFRDLIEKYMERQCECRGGSATLPGSTEGGRKGFLELGVRGEIEFLQIEKREKALSGRENGRYKGPEAHEG